MYRTSKDRGAAISRLDRSLVAGRGDVAEHARHRLPYRPALDGIRALAVAAVLAYHAGLPWAKGGFLGVDAFFVLSGYLIASLLLAEWESGGRISLTAFWARRAQRLLPALFLVLLGVGGYALVFAKPDELDKLRGDALATLGYVANWRPVFTGQSYFEQFSVPSPLRHTWSLAIEEQWYLVWPLLVLAVLRLRRGSLGTLLVVALVLAAASASLMGWLYHPQTDPSRVYYGTDTRAQSLLVGAVLAMLLLRRGPVNAGPARHMLQFGALACAAYVGWIWVTTSENNGFLYRGGFLVLAVAVAVVIAAVVQPNAGLLGKLLSLTPLRGLGIISYGVYLWHWPVYIVLTPDRTGWEGNSLLAVRLAATLAIAIVSYYLIEKPFRRGVLRGWRPTWALAPAGAMGLAAALVLMTRGGEPAFTAPAMASGPMPVSVSASVGSRAGTGVPTRVLLVGDSVAWSMGQGLERVGQAWNLSVWNRGRYACGFSEAESKLLHGRWLAPEEGCRNLHSLLQSYLDEFHPDAVVVVIGAADAYDLRVDGRVIEFGTAEADAYALSEMRHAIDLLTSQGAKVFLLTAPYSGQRDLALATEETYVEPWRVDWLNRNYQQVAQEYPGQVTLIDLNRFLSPDSEYADLIDGVDIRSDGLHFSPEGAEVVAGWLAPQIAQVVGEQGRAVSQTDGVTPPQQ